ncbi:MAG TPA: hypothetical protein ENK47_08895, partial [Euryarchaeota archaeon]|nr:hypothetical protein [Euryarchaeota archaeon]
MQRILRLRGRIWTATLIALLLTIIPSPFPENVEVLGNVNGTSMPTRGTENLTVTIVPTAAAEGDDVIPANVSIGSSLTTDLV